jgi:hypothetical protein
MRDTTEEDPREVAASKFELNYIGMDGDIGCMGSSTPFQFISDRSLSERSRIGNGNYGHY